ncbi:hypothetical protein [Nannocystis pusilla]|uniref:hypothetical protein n=1 Tax=Nannocystis pusilla TaxID=889268 RepID=UPI003B7B6863
MVVAPSLSEPVEAGCPVVVGSTEVTVVVSTVVVSTVVVPAVVASTVVVPGPVLELEPSAVSPDVWGPQASAAAVNTSNE